MNRYPLGRREEFDERSRLYRAVELISTKELRSYTWSCDVFNNQGKWGACVGFSFSHELSARPKVYRVGEDVAHAIYNRAKVLDPWPGENYDGTSVLAGVKAVMEMKGVKGLPLIQEYRWAFGIEEVVRVLGRRGPVVLGVLWYQGMWDTDVNGFVSPTGEVVGGHAIMANGVRCVWKDPLSTDRTWTNLDTDKSYVKLHNSWGTGWGQGGTCKITVKDLGVLLTRGGEACIPMRRTV